MSIRFRSSGSHRDGVTVRREEWTRLIKCNRIRRNSGVTHTSLLTVIVMAVYLLMLGSCIGSTTGNLISSRGLSMISNNLPFLIHKNVQQLGNKVSLSEEQQNRLTLTTSVPFYRSDGNLATFSVKFNKKQRKTAIGFSTTRPPTDTYLIPDYYSSGGYVSMGGAGFLYPMRTSASRGYKEGDLVTAEINFAAAMITFSVNGARVGSAPWPSADASSSMISEAYPFISCEGGAIVMDVWSG